MSQSWTLSEAQARRTGLRAAIKKEKKGTSDYKRFVKQLAAADEIIAKAKARNAGKTRAPGTRTR